MERKEIINSLKSLYEEHGNKCNEIIQESLAQKKNFESLGKMVPFKNSPFFWEDVDWVLLEGFNFKKDLRGTQFYAFGDILHSLPPNPVEIPID